MDDQQNNSSRSGRKPVSKTGFSKNSKNKRTSGSKSGGLLRNSRIRALLAGFCAVIVLLFIVLIASGAFDSAALKQEKAEKAQAAAEKVQEVKETTETATEEETTAAKETATEQKINLDARTVYFTFDAGPSSNTESILDALDENNIKGTFFVETENGDPDLMKEIVDRGHAIGVYSVSGDTGEIYASVDNFKNDLNSCRQTIFTATGALSEVYRFPGGSHLAAEQISMKDCKEVLTDLGMQYYDWNIESGDDMELTVDAQTLADVINGNLGVTEFKTNVVLLHDADSKTTTAEALNIVIPQLKEAGFEFGKLTADTPEMTFDIEE